MSKIYGDENTIKKAKAAQPGDNTVLINWEAIADLPDEYEAIISEVKFKISDDFSDVGNKTYMPTPALHYKIAEARGIHGGSNSITNPIYEDVDVNQMNMVDTPFFTKMLVGYRSVKYSTVMEEDGTQRRSSACTIDYNVWNRCADAWSSEELATEGYSLLQDGDFTVTEWGKTVKKTGKHYKSKKGYTTEPKYDTKWKRKSHFQTELKFAMQKAETKAHEKTIRELAGLMTGYKETDLKSGCLIFAKIRRSRKILQAETAARLVSLSNGNQSKPNLLFGELEDDVVIQHEPVKGGTIIENETIVNEQPEVKTPKQWLIESIETYGKNISEELMDTADAVLKWLDKTESPETTTFWGKAINLLKTIEEDMPEDFRVKHGLY